MGDSKRHQTNVSCIRLRERVWSCVLSASTPTGIPCISLNKLHGHSAAVTGERAWGAHNGSGTGASRHGAWAHGAGPCGAIHLKKGGRSGPISRR